MLAGAIALMASSTPLVKRCAAQAGVNGNAATMKREGMHEGTGGMTTGTGARSPIGSPTSMPKAQGSPDRRPRLRPASLVYRHLGCAKRLPLLNRNSDHAWRVVASPSFHNH